MIIRLVGLALIAIGAIFAVMFVYLPIHNGAGGVMGPVSTKALVFIPLAVVAGLALMIGGAPVMSALQGGPKTKSQRNLALLIIGIAGVISGVSYWQVKSRWMRAPEPVILPLPGPPPQVPARR